MKAYVLANQEIAMSLGLSLSEACVFDYLKVACTYAESRAIDGKVYFQVPYSQILEAMPIVVRTKSSMSQKFAALRDRNLIETTSHRGRNWVRVVDVQNEQVWQQVMTNHESRKNELQ